MTTWTRHEPAIVQCGGEDSRRVTESRAAIWSRKLDRRHDLVAGEWMRHAPASDLYAVVYFSAYGAREDAQNPNTPMYVEIEYGFLIVGDPDILNDPNNPIEQWYRYHNAGPAQVPLTDDDLIQVLAADIDESMDSHGDGDGIMDDELWNRFMNSDIEMCAGWALLGANP